MRFINYFDCLSFNLLGQLLVVARHTDTSPSSCYELGLIPDLCWPVYPHTAKIWDQMLITAGINRYSTGRDFGRNGIVVYHM